jgi:hypothetical protein|tara:strand:- start:815 stop:1123 length:309 start_codon:yes stop_codon:yes gene_type:complete
MSFKKTPLDEEPFGIKFLKKLDVGDLVRWSELGKTGYKQEAKVGIISELYLERRGNRNVALAKVHEVTNKKNLSPMGRQREILVVNLELLSKVGTKNELFPI